MDANRWNQVDQLLGAALDLEPEARSGFLTQTCGEDNSLRTEVEKLLAAHQQAGSFIETSAMQVAAQALAGETLHARIRQQIGSYRVISLLGVGGMGEVYLAEDTRLGRRVALKILPSPFVVDQDRVRRFEREARAASALNHPNIITIYAIGHEDSIHYIATEYVEGEIVRARLKSGRMGLVEAINIATQIAAALVAAHGAGITHRDIKPDNVILRQDGYVKVLDFGLAKLTSPAGSEKESLSHSLETHSGLIVGTIKYMSPEQALGQTVDSRTDLWSLGVMLYEMITGQPPFHGDSRASVFDGILNRAPTPVMELYPDLPADIEAIINRALEKDPEMRYQTAADLRADLLRLQKKLRPGSSKFGRAVTRLRLAKTAGSGWRPRAALLFCLAGLLAVAGWDLWKPRPPAVQPQGPKWTRATAIQLTSGPGAEYFPDLAADGKGLIYASRLSGNWDIYWQRVGGKNAVNLTRDSDADDTQPAYSPDGSLIAFRSERSPKGIYVMEATSENVRRVSDLGHHPSWSPDNKELVVCVDSPAIPTARSIIPSALWIIDLGTGAKRMLTEVDAVQPDWSPHGHRIAYWGLQPGGGQRDIWTIPAAGGEAIPVTTDDALDWNPLWSPDGQFLYFASDRGGSMNFWRVRIDEQTGEVQGRPEAVTTPSGYSQHLSFSADGKHMAYVQRAETQNLQRIAFDPVNGKTSGIPEAIVQGTEYVTEPDMSPDGEWIVYSSQGERQEDIFVIKTDGSNQRQLTNDRFNDRSPTWSPDGGRVAFYSDRGGRYEIWTINVDGRGLQQLTFTSGRATVYPIWSPDGSRMVFKQRGQSPFILRPGEAWQTQTPPQLALPPEPEGAFWPSSWSPDGRKLAGALVVSSQNSVYTYDFETQSYERLTTFGTNPVWLKDNRRLLFISEGDVFLVDSQTGKNHQVLSFPSHEIRSVCLSKDDRALYYTPRRTEADIWLLSLDVPRK